MRIDRRRDATAYHLWLRNGVIWAALMLLMSLSLAMAYIPLGPVTTISGIVIAFAKALLVMLLFMELLRARPVVRLAAMAGAVFLIAMFTLTLADVLSRLAGR